ncbi:hypothetical protein DEU34_1359 [Microbacterium sp. AG1240]|nr:hypothetical protein DEU34_1359 [Microbacterium sp. AG1240]
MAMSIEHSPTRVTAIAAGNEGRLFELLDDWLKVAGEGGASAEASYIDVDPQTNRIKLHRDGSHSTLDAHGAVSDWVAEKRRLRIAEFSVHEYPQALEIWRRFEIRLRDGAYVATFVEATGEYKVTAANGDEIGSISVRPQGWVGKSRSIDSNWSATTTEPRDTPREAFGVLLRTLGFKG